MLTDPLVTGAAPGTLTLPAPGAPTAKPVPPNDIAMTWQANHFMKGQNGLTYVPFTITLDRTNLPGKNAALYDHPLRTAVVYDWRSPAEILATAVPPAVTPEAEAPDQTATPTAR